MRSYIDHVLALLPFEPAVHLELGGPPCTYVGHPLAERVDQIRTANGEVLRQQLGLDRGRKTLVVLPGSRKSEVEKLMAPFGGAVDLLAAELGGLNIVIPAVAGLEDHIRNLSQSWHSRPAVIVGDENKYSAFRCADVALAASGTVTLELGLAGTPMVVAYMVDPIAASLGFLVKTPHFALSNLVLGERAFPELMQNDCTPLQLSAALKAIVRDPDVMTRQREALSRIPGLIAPADTTPSIRAARTVLQVIEGARPSAVRGQRA